jgi:hypothetical protein
MRKYESDGRTVADQQTEGRGKQGQERPGKLCMAAGDVSEGEGDHWEIELYIWTESEQRREGGSEMGKAIIRMVSVLCFLVSATYAQAGYMGIQSGNIGGIFMLLIVIGLLYLLVIACAVIYAWLKEKIKKWVSGWK